MDKKYVPVLTLELLELASRCMMPPAEFSDTLIRLGISENIAFLFQMHMMNNLSKDNCNYNILHLYAEYKDDEGCVDAIIKYLRYMHENWVIFTRPPFTS